jgi:hypothetical protein
VRDTRRVVRDEIDRLTTWGERHRQLLARLTIALVLTAIVDVVGATLMWMFDDDVRRSDITTYGDALFFATVQLLTVSSQMTNPVTTAGRLVDVFLEVWALFVVAAVAGSFAAFFGGND